jgi:hypothetical protein
MIIGKEMEPEKLVVTSMVVLGKPNRSRAVPRRGLRYLSGLTDPE